MAKKTTTKKNATEKTTSDVNKSDEVRSYKLDNPEAGPTEISVAMGKKGVKVSANNVSNILGKAGLTKKRKRRGRPKKKAAAPATTSSISDVGQLKAAAKFISECGGDMRNAQRALKDANEIVKSVK